MDRDDWLITLAQSKATSVFWEDGTFATLTAPEQVFVAIWTLEGDVNNGGFDQYYFNSGGDYARVAPDALRQVGAQRTAELVDQANLIFGADGPPADRAARQAALESLSESERDGWEPLEQTFYEEPDDLTNLLYDYVQAHRDQIRGAA